MVVALCSGAIITDIHVLYIHLMRPAEQSMHDFKEGDKVAPHNQSNPENLQTPVKCILQAFVLMCSNVFVVVNKIGRVYL